jgi:predicted enzyme related to lactoylglutathione lyase
MPPSLANGKICYIEMPATDIARSAEFYKAVFGWTSANAAMAERLLTIPPAK